MILNRIRLRTKAWVVSEDLSPRKREPDFSEKDKQISRNSHEQKKRRAKTQKAAFAE